MGRRPRRRLYPPACKPYGLEAEPEARAGWHPVLIARDRSLSNKPKFSLQNGVSRARRDLAGILCCRCNTSQDEDRELSPWKPGLGQGMLV